MNPANTLLGGVFEITAGIVGIALIALLINRSQQTAQVISASGATLNNLLRTVTLQNGSSMNFNAGAGFYPYG